MALNFDSRISAFEQLGLWLEHFLKEVENNRFTDDFNSEFQAIIERQSRENGWFTQYNIYSSLAAIRDNLQAESLNNLRFVYGNRIATSWQEKIVAVVTGAFFPLVSFYDFMVVLLTGNVLQIKLHADDKLLLPKIAQKLMEIEPDFSEKIQFVDQLHDFERVIITEENGHSEVLCQYFSKYPMFVHRRQRAAAILTGNETLTQLRALSNDICRYFGNTFRSVSKVYLPKKYNFTNLLQAIQGHTEQLNEYNAYLSNLEYQKGISLLNSIPFYDAGSMILIENEQFFPPKSVLYYQYYDKIDDAIADCEAHKEQISCVVALPGISAHFLPLGNTYRHDFQSNVIVSDIVEFLI